jgi:hypothetical protein
MNGNNSYPTDDDLDQTLIKELNRVVREADMKVIAKHVRRFKRSGDDVVMQNATEHGSEQYLIDQGHRIAVYIRKDLEFDKKYRKEPGTITAHQDYWREMLYDLESSFIRHKK